MHQDQDDKIFPTMRGSCLLDDPEEEWLYSVQLFLGTHRIDVVLYCAMPSYTILGDAYAESWWYQELRPAPMDKVLLDRMQPLFLFSEVLAQQCKAGRIWKSFSCR